MRARSGSSTLSPAQVRLIVAMTGAAGMLFAFGAPRPYGQKILARALALAEKEKYSYGIGRCIFIRGQHAHLEGRWRESLAELPHARRFCPACGQETNVKPPKLSEFVQQFGGAYFSTEGALWRTLKLLLFKPGELTVRYLAGQRKHYVLPLRLYLTISVLVLVLMRSLAGSSNLCEWAGNNFPGTGLPCFGCKRNSNGAG